MTGPLTDLTTWTLPGAAALGGIAVGILVRRTGLRWLAKMAARSSFKYDDVLVEAVGSPLVVWFALIGLRLAVKFLPLDPTLDSKIGTVILVLGILSVSWAIARFAGGALRVASHAGGVTLLSAIIRALIFGLGILIILQTLGISITPIITALGIGGLAVGLALQDTLANFFAGIRILAARTIRVGDYVQLEGGQEGWVRDIAWGQTTIFNGAGNIVIIPNSKLSTAVTTNYALPDLPQIVVVNFGVAYGSDLEHVEKVALEVALDTLHGVPEGVSAFTPALRWKELGDSSINAFVVLQSRNYPDRWAVISAFIKRLHARFLKEGIEIPFPVRTVRLEQQLPPALRPGSPASPTGPTSSRP